LAMILSVFVSFPLVMILSVFCQFPFGHDIGCLLSVSLWPWYWLSFISFPLAMILAVFVSNMAKGKLQKTANIMAKGKLTKDSLYHGQRETD
jgi:ABC-type phosphate transport system permease subunit